MIESLKKLDTGKIELELYKKRRRRYNDLLKLKKKQITSFELLEKNALFIWLNKTCFNGLYRVNSKGEFNVPWNKSSRFYYDYENLFAISEYLNQSDISICCGDYEKVLQKVQGSDFIYFDPPYDLQKKETFQAYTAIGFDKKEQKKLAAFCTKLDSMGTYWMLCNHNTPDIQLFYSEFNITEIETRRSINVEGSKRKTGREVIVLNYDWKKENQREIIENPGWYVDFDLIMNRMEEWKNSLNKIQKLIAVVSNSIEFRDSFLRLIKKDLTAQELFHFLKTLGMLISKRWKHSREIPFPEWHFQKPLNDSAAKEIFDFFARTNLFNLFISKKLPSLFDYLVGVEAGMGSNTRKNRTGKMFEKMIQDLLHKYLLYDFYEQITLKTFYAKLNKTKQTKYFLLRDSSKTFSVLNKKLLDKKFDFSFELNEVIYFVECNYYNTQGSKISETARAYLNLAKELKITFQKVRFIWITGGRGWKKVSNWRTQIQDELGTLFMNKDSFEKWLRKNLSKKTSE